MQTQLPPSRLSSLQRTCAPCFKFPITYTKTFNSSNKFEPGTLMGADWHVPAPFAPTIAIKRPCLDNVNDAACTDLKFSTLTLKMKSCCGSI